VVRCFGVALVSSFIGLIALSSVGLVGSSICWTRSLVVGICPLALSSTLCRWAMPSIVGLYPSLLGSPFGAGLPSAAPSSLGSTFCRAFIVGLCLPPLGYNLHCWALSLWHLLRRRGGLSSSFVVLIVLNPSFGWYHHCWCSALRLGLLGKGLRCVMCRRWVGGMRAC